MKHILAIFLLSSCCSVAYTQSSHQNSVEESIIALINASILFENQQEHAQALQQMKAAEKLDGEDYFVHLRLGWLHYLNEDYNLSEKHYRRALALADNSIEARLGLTLPLAAREEWLQVESIYQAILKIDPENYDATLRLGQMYYYRDDLTRAEEYLRRLHERFPADYETTLTLAWIQQTKGRSKLARELFQRVLMMSPSDSSATRGLESVR